MRKWGGIALLFCLVGCWAAPTAVYSDQRIYIAPDDHTDYFWSADEDAYRAAFLSMLDFYLNLADSTAGNDPEYQSRWNCDGHFWMWTYAKNRSAAQFQRLIDRIEDGHVSVPLNGLSVCLGGAPAEAVLRGMYYPGYIERAHGLRFRLAYSMENQTLPCGLVSLWAGSGAKYSWKGICGCDSQVPSPGDREHDIYRARGLDGATLLFKWNSMLNGNESMGGYAEARDPNAVVNFVTVNAGSNGFAARYPYDVIGCFGKGWDDLQTQTNQFVTTAMNKTNATRQVIVSNEQDFFEDFESTYDVSTLPAQTCSFGNEWELYVAGMAEVSARAKRSVEKLRAAEAMAAIVSLFNPSFMDGRQNERDLAWIDLGLFYEHDFGMVGPPTGSAGIAKRIAWQHRIAGEIETYVNSLHDDAATALATLIDDDGANRFYVFNPLGWVRTDVADLAYSGPTPVHVVDLVTQDEVPSQIVTVNSQNYLRILATDLPSVGYKVYEIQGGAGSSFGDAASVSGSGATRILENDRYKLTIAERGAITSLIDKTRSNREFAQSFGGKFINDMGASTGTLLVENVGPVSVTVKAVASSPVAHTSRITLYRDIDRIDMDNQITQNFNSVRTYTFGFALSSPDVRHEEVGAILRAKLLAHGGDYSPRNARYDWLTLNHFADMTGSGDVGITLCNADCYFFKLGNSTTTSLDTSSPAFTVLAGGNVANGSNGIANQGGDTHFTQRFSLRTHDVYHAAAAMKTSVEHQNPPVCRTLTATDPHLPASTFSALSISNPNTLLWTFKIAEEGPAAGWIARLWNVSDEDQESTIKVPKGQIVLAKRISHIETNETDQTITSKGITGVFQQQQIRSYRLFSFPTLPGNPTEDDVDGDGVANDDDVCPDDPFKSSDVGDCGCGQYDFDVDGNGVIDCRDGPNGPGPNPIPGVDECCGGGAATAAPMMLLGWIALRRRRNAAH